MEMEMEMWWVHCERLAAWYTLMARVLVLVLVTLVLLLATTRMALVLVPTFICCNPLIVLVPVQQHRPANRGCL
jgi:hypothetical protein